MEELEEEEDKSKATEDTEGTFSPQSVKFTAVCIAKGRWKVHHGNEVYAWPTYPAIDGSHGNYWVAHLIDSASTYVNEEYDLIEFFYACGIPSG